MITDIETFTQQIETIKSNSLWETHQLSGLLIFVLCPCIPYTPATGHLRFPKCTMVVFLQFCTFLLPLPRLYFFLLYVGYCYSTFNTKPRNVFLWLPNSIIPYPIFPLQSGLGVSLNSHSTLSLLTSTSQCLLCWTLVVFLLFLACTLNP